MNKSELKKLPVGTEVAFSTHDTSDWSTDARNVRCGVIVEHNATQARDTYSGYIRSGVRQVHGTILRFEQNTRQDDGSWAKQTVERFVENRLIVRTWEDNKKALDAKATRASAIDQRVAHAQDLVAAANTVLGNDKAYNGPQLKRDWEHGGYPTGVTLSLADFEKLVTAALQTA